MATDIEVKIHLIVRPDLSDYGEMPPDAPRAEAAIEAASNAVWIDGFDGTWTERVARTKADGPLSFKALIETVEDKLQEYTVLHAPTASTPLQFSLASNAESDVYYYRDPPAQWCIHSWGLLQMAQDGSSGPPQAWEITNSVTYEDEGVTVTKELHLMVQVSAAFDVDWV